MLIATTKDFGQLLEIYCNIVDISDRTSAKVRVGYSSEEAIPTKFVLIFGKHILNLRITVESRMAYDGATYYNV